MYEPQNGPHPRRTCDECDARLDYQRSVGNDPIRSRGSIYRCPNDECDTHEVLRRSDDDG